MNGKTELNEQQYRDHLKQCNLTDEEIVQVIHRVFGGKNGEKSKVPEKVLSKYS
jgi:hypothetical protein